MILDFRNRVCFEQNAVPQQECRIEFYALFWNRDGWGV